MKAKSLVLVLSFIFGEISASRVFLPSTVSHHRRHDYFEATLVGSESARYSIPPQMVKSSCASFFEDRGAPCSVLRALSKMCDVKAILGDLKQKYTLFAPTDDAFMATAKLMGYTGGTEGVIDHFASACGAMCKTDSVWNTKAKCLEKLIKYHIADEMKPFHDMKKHQKYKIKAISGDTFEYQQIDAYHCKLIDQSSLPDPRFSLKDSVRFYENGFVIPVDKVLWPFKKLIKKGSGKSAGGWVVSISSDVGKGEACYGPGERNIGARDRVYIDYAPCCDGQISLPKENDWGNFCPVGGGNGKLGGGSSGAGSESGGWGMKRGGSRDSGGTGSGSGGTVSGQNVSAGTGSGGKISSGKGSVEETEDTWPKGKVSKEKNVETFHWNVDKNGSYPSPSASPRPAQKGIVAKKKGVLASYNSYKKKYASPTPPPDSSAVCFPGDALVNLEDGSSIRMSELSIGQKVAVGGGQFSDVFAFTHADNKRKYSFVRIDTSGGRSLIATDSHFIYLNGIMKPAGSARVGDYLVRDDGSHDDVVVVGRETRSGLYNPQTISGDIIVNGFLSSTYTTAIEPRIASALLGPVRSLYRLGFPRRLLSLPRGGGSRADWLFSRSGSAGASEDVLQKGSYRRSVSNV